jgi:hypothetical protein
MKFGTAVTPTLPQRLQRMRGPKDGTVASSGQSSISTARSWPQCWQVTNKSHGHRAGAWCRASLGEFVSLAEQTGNEIK